MNNLFQTKNISFEIKDLDTAGRRVKFAAAAFNNVDSDNDTISYGAFSKSIQERGAESTSNRKIKFLRYHDFEHEIGLIKHMEETHDHLVVTADLGRSTKGNDAFLDYQDGIITEHSIGFMLVQDKINYLDSGVRELKEVNLMECSAVTFGANSETPVFSISKGNETEYLEKLNNQVNGYLNALRNGKGTDDRLSQIENNLRVCQLKYNNLINSLKEDKPLNNTDLIEPNEAKEFYLNLLKKS
jgi:HK97 family phage prohead protease